MSKSLLNKYTKEELQIIIDECSSIREVLRKIGYTSFSGNMKTFYNKVKNLNLEKLNLNKQFLKNSVINRFNNKISKEDLLKENCIHSRGKVKRFILENKLLNYECARCKNNGQWLNVPLTLQLEHINGINNDNRIENLCFLCPNCHCQTPTWGNKKRTKKLKKERKKKFNVEINELINLLKEMSIVDIGKKFNVSDNAIRKRCEKLNIEIPKYKKGHWLKKN